MPKPEPLPEPAPDPAKRSDTSAMLDIALQLYGAIADGRVRALSLLIVVDEDGVAVPRHICHAPPAATVALLGGYALASHDLLNTVAVPPAASAAILRASQ